MDLGLSGKRALVTGASSGLGLAAAVELSREGAEVIISSRSQDKLGQAVQSIKNETGKNVTAIAADITVESDIDKLIKQSPAIDILVSNGGGPPPGQFTDKKSADWDNGYQLVLRSAINLTEGVIGGMIERKFGRLIYITSVGVLQPVDDLIVSNTFRAGVTGLCKTISNNYAKHGITANAVCPGYTATDRLVSLADSRAAEIGSTRDEVLNSFAELIPAGRIGKPEELAYLIAFLAGDTGAYITGSSIAVDGGAVKSLLS